ncbi:MAG TPA: tetratricopeptide repeat protein [Methyloprofundus sp.]|uniref:tetratricopeptide repeat protein n=1 Tax=Methyloprofundus sp. TaxID=2020875 RepID=UPI001814738E|nr:tetratricopeptide repeat protein [Methyloprofundus sp.]HIG65550.1 tetratricopeptide repeat protein [Methyloprofundus sp.]HIL77440.1 tetratricopeptide repeat protein [Methylococcales bacterium]
MTRHKISTLTAWLFIFLLPVSENSYAFEWQDLWQTSEQQAQQEYSNGNYQQAAEQFTEPAWQAAARYKADKALSEEEQMLPASTDTGFYNQGNVLAKSGQLDNAIEAYDQALNLNPDNKDAQYNKELVEKALEQQEQQQQEQDKNQQQQDKKDQEDDQSGDQQEQQNQQGEQSEEQSEQQSGQQEKQDSQEQDAAQDQQQDSASETDEEQDQEDMQPQQGEADKEENPAEQEAESAQASEESVEEKEEQQASEQWLKRIPDDPSGLLKRKFKYQYGRQKQPQNSGQQW